MEIGVSMVSKNTMYIMHKNEQNNQYKLHKMKNKIKCFVIKIKKWHASCSVYRQKAKQQRTLLQLVAVSYLPNQDGGKAKSSEHDCRLSVIQ